MFLKSFFLCCAALLAFSAQSNGQYTLNMPYQHVDVENVKGEAVFKGSPTYGQPGQPNLPMYTVTFLVPSGIDPKDVTVSVENPVDSLLSGSFYIAPAFPPMKGDQGDAPVGEYPKDMSIYGQNDFFPASWIGSVTYGKMRDNQLVKVTVNPCRYNPVSGAIKMLVGGTLTVSVAGQAKMQSVVPSSTTAPVRDEMTKKLLKDLIVNPEQLNDASQSIQTQLLQEAAAPAAANTYAIITTNAIVTASANASKKLTAYISYLQSAGFNVVLATENTWGGGTGNTAAERIRTWLKNNYISSTIQYALLIGNPNPSSGDVPMKMSYPDQKQAGDSSGEAIPTDYYYAELTGNWDVNGNGHYGEYYDDFKAGGPDQYAEIAVGRIPYYGVIADLEKILQKSITYANANASSREWRKSILFPIVPYDKTTPNFQFAEQVKSNILTGQQISYCRLYDEKYADSSYADIVNMYPPFEQTPCNENNVLSAWTRNYFGMVAWATHGGATGASDVFSASNASKLDDAHPSMVFESSCDNAYPENSGNLAYSLLRNGAITTIAATRNGIYWFRQTDFMNTPSGCGLAYTYALCSFAGFTSGFAHNIMISWAADWGCAGWRNFLTHNVYGCPEMTMNIPGNMPAAPTRLQVTSGSQTIFTLSWSDNANNETGYSIESATSVSGPYSQVTLTAADVTAMLISANPGNKRYFRVRAANGTVYSPYSNIDSGTTYTNIAQGKTVTYSSQQTGNEGAKAVDGNATSTRWAASSATMPQWLKADLGSSRSITGFEIVFERTGTSGDCNDFKIETSSDNTTWTLAVDRSTNTNTAPTQTYSWSGTARYARITISDAPGTYYASIYEFRVSGPSAPPAPVWKSSSTALDNQLYLEWQASPNATTYDVKRSTVSGGPYLTFASGVTGTSITTCCLVAGTTYYFAVSAVNSAGHSANSAELQKAAVATTPAAPTSLWAYSEYTDIILSWTDNSFVETSFYIEQASSVSGPWTVVMTNPVNTRRDTLYGFAENSTYHFRVRAYGQGGYSAYSNVASASTVPAAPSGLTATAASGNQINLAWTDNSGVESGFDIYQSLYNKGPFDQVTSVGENIRTGSVTGLTAGTTYWFMVKAWNGAGSSWWSNMVSATTPVTSSYTITASAGTGGAISPSGSVVVNSGASRTFTITPNSGYKINVVTVDGVSQGAITSYTFSNVIANHTISATFALNLKIEAENAALAGGAKKNTDHTGYSGTGFVDGYYNSTTAQTTFTVNVPAAGSYKLILRYSAGNAASSNTGLYINSTTVKLKNISCPKTTNWDTWANQQETVTLNAGNNTIMYKAVTSSTASINLDYLTVTP